MHIATIQWQRNEHVFSDGKYSRAHRWFFDGGAEVEASPSPHIVPAPMSVAENVDPEEAFIAAVSSCHMLFFLEIACKNKFVIDRYDDPATGTMTENERGRLFVSKIVLRPEIVFIGERIPDLAKLEKMHHQSHEMCFIANSILTDVVVDVTEAIKG